MRASVVRAAALGLVFGVAACSGATTKHAPGPSKKGPEVRSADPILAAQWLAHPAEVPRPIGAMRLANGTCLLIEADGQRWLSSPFTAAEKAAQAAASSRYFEGEEDEDFGATNLTPLDVPRNCSGHAIAAIDHPPEPLMTMVRGKTTFGFVGESGTVHLTESPLGKFTRRTYPQERMLSVRSAGRTTLGISETGKVYRWDEENGYVLIPLQDVHAIDLAVDRSGEALLLAVPEALYSSTNGGRTFERREAPKMGATRVEKHAGKPFLIKGWAGNLAWNPKEPGVFIKTDDQGGEHPLLNVDLQTGFWPNADSVHSGSGAFDGDHYYQMITTQEGPALYGGVFGQPLKRQPAAVEPEFSGNGQVWIAVRQPHMAFLAMTWGDDGLLTKVRISHDRGQTFSKEIPLLTSGGGQLEMAISAQGTTLITSACFGNESLASGPNSSFDEDSEGCQREVLRIAGDGTKSTAKGATMTGTAVALAFSKDGQSAYFLGESDSTDELALFVSQDAGVSFTERPLHLSENANTKFVVAPDVRITASENGTVGMVLMATGDKPGLYYVTTDESGQRVRANEVPEGPNLVAGYGDHVLAVPTFGGATIDAKPIWESQNGGATWKSFPSPEILWHVPRHRGDLACDAGGCVISNAVSRVGWGEHPDEREPFQVKTNEEHHDDPRRAIHCEPKQGATWTRIPHVADDFSLPNEHNAGRRTAAWMVATHDRKTGAMGVVAAPFPKADGSAGPIVTKQILGPTPKGGVWATAVRAQIEGVAFSRAKISDSAKVTPLGWTNKPFKNLEIGWENEEEGTSGRGVIPNAGKFDLYTVSDFGTGAFGLELPMCSVSPKGTFVRPSWNDRTAYFVDLQGKVKTFRIPAANVEGRNEPLEASDVIHVDGAFVPNHPAGGRSLSDPEELFLMQPPAANSPPGTLWNLWAMTLAPGDDSRNYRYTLRDWTYDGGYLARWTIHVVPKAGYAAGWLTRVLADGTLSTPRKIGLPYDLSALPRPCTEAEREREPRVKVPLSYRTRRIFPGTSHPVLVSEVPSQAADSSSVPKHQVAMEATGYVVRGEPASTCLDILAASGGEAVPRSVLLVGDLTQGWLFRHAANVPSKQASAASSDAHEAQQHDFETLPLSCRMAAAPPPRE